MSTIHTPNDIGGSRSLPFASSNADINTFFNEPRQESGIVPSYEPYIFGGQSQRELTNAGGAPALQAPGGNAASSNAGQIDAMLLYELVISRTQNERVSMSRAEVEAGFAKIDANTELQIRKIREQADASAPLASLSLGQKVLGWLGAIAATVGAIAATALAVAATVATGGLAAPLIFVAAMAVASAVYMLVDITSRTCGGAGVNLGKHLQNMFCGVLESCGVSHERAEGIAKILTGVTAFLVPVLFVLEPQLVGGMVGQLAKVAGVPPEYLPIIEAAVMAVCVVVSIVVMGGLSLGAGALGAMAAVKGLGSIGSLSRIVIPANQVVGGVVGGLQGGTNIAVAVVEKDVNDVAADQKLLSVVMATLEAKVRGSIEGLTRVVDDLSVYTRGLDDMIKTLADGRDAAAAGAAPGLAA